MDKLGHDSDIAKTTRSGPGTTPRGLSAFILGLRVLRLRAKLSPYVFLRYVHHPACDARTAEDMCVRPYGLFSFPYLQGRARCMAALCAREPQRAAEALSYGSETC